MGGFFGNFRDSWRLFFGCANRNINADIVILLVAVVLVISLLLQPLILTALALIGLMAWSLFF